LTRTLPAWNKDRARGFYLIADDIAGGFFAINGGTLGDDLENIYYFAPDTLKWEPLRFGYSDLLHWVCAGKYEEFCKELRWPGWEADIANVSGNRCLMNWPPRFTKEGQELSARRGEISIEEAWGFQMELARQMNSVPNIE
jgi:hypothetical protein